jgi:hypothetical protein
MRFFLRVLPSRDLLAVQPIRWLVLSRLCASIFFYSTTIVLFQHQRGLNFTAMFLMESILSGAIWIADVPTSIWADRFGYRLASACSRETTCVYPHAIHRPGAPLPSARPA